MGVATSKMASSSEMASDSPAKELEEETLSPSHIVQPSWSSLSREELIDKIKGVIYGQAIGDAIGIYMYIYSVCVTVCVYLIGLATEFMSKEQSYKTYGPSGPASYKDIVPDFHRSR